MAINFPTRSMSFFRSSFSSILWTVDLFRDIFQGGKAYSYKVSSDITPEEVCILHTAILNQELFLSSKIQNSSSGRKVSILADTKKNTLREGSIPEGIDEETGFLLINMKGGEINV